MSFFSDRLDLLDGGKTSPVLFIWLFDCKISK